MTPCTEIGWIAQLFHNGAPLDERVAHSLTQTARRQFVGRGCDIIRQGERSRSFFVLVAGAARVVMEELDGEDVARLGAGAIFGEMAAVACEPRSATVRAIEPCEIVEIDAGPLEAHPEFWAFLGRLGIERTEATLYQLVEAR